MTLVDYGSRTVSVCGDRTFARCTFSFGVAMDGTKTPSLIIFKGRGGGRIIREFTGEEIP